MLGFLRLRISRWLAAALIASALMLSIAGTAGASSNTQVILSATGISTSAGPAGFWLWSQPDSPNAYGNGGNGSIYFYALLPASHHADVTNVVVSGNTVTESVTSTDGLINCPWVTGTETASAKGTVSFTCYITTASGVVTATATDQPAEVHISG